MKLSKFIMIILFCTIISLIYIQLQIQIFELAYQGKNKEEQLQKIIDVNDRVTYNILTLKSADHLGIKLLKENSKLQFLDQEYIVRLETPSQFLEDDVLVKSADSEKNTNIFLSLFSLKSKAEASAIK